MMSLDHPYEWMNRAIDETEKPRFEDTVWFDALQRDQQLQLEALRMRINRIIRLMESPDAHEKDVSFAAEENGQLIAMLDAEAESAQAVIDRLSRFSFATMPRKSAAWAEQTV